MTEIKGQLLGLILVLMIFAVVSTAVAQIFSSSKDNVVSKADSAFINAETELSYTDPSAPSGGGN